MCIFSEPIYVVGFFLHCVFIQRERKQWTVYCTSPQSFKVFLICWLNNFGTFTELVVFFKFSIQTYQPLLNYRRGDFVYHPWGCTLIYRPLSYPIRFLVFIVPIKGTRDLYLFFSGRKSLKNQPRGVIKWGIINIFFRGFLSHFSSHLPQFYDVTWLIF